MGVTPPAEILRNLGLPVTQEPTTGEQSPSAAVNPFASILPLLTSWPAVQKDTKTSHILIAKGLPTLPAKLVAKAQSLEFVEMEEFLPTPRSLRLAEQRRPNPSLQESLVGALNHFQALQQQKAQRRVLDVMTWTRCFTLYMAVVAKTRAEMVPYMAAHLHTVFKLYHRAPQSAAWLEYDVQFRMEAAASDDKVWSGGDSWQYISCLPGPVTASDPFEMVGEQRPPQLSGPLQTQDPPGSYGQGSKLADPAKGRVLTSGKPPLKRPRKSAGTCRLFNGAPGGCPYGSKCIFTHRCTNCGAIDAHTTVACPLPRRPQN